MLRVSLDDLTICPEIGSPFTWGPSSPGALKVERRKLLFFFALFQNIKTGERVVPASVALLLISLIFFFFFFQTFFFFFFYSFLTVTLNAPLFSDAVLPPSPRPLSSPRALAGPCPPFAVDAVSALLRSFFHPTLWNERGCFHSHSCHTLGPFVFDRNP